MFDKDVGGLEFEHLGVLGKDAARTVDKTYMVVSVKIEGGPRTSTLRARTPVQVAVASADDMQAEALAELASHHRREEA